MRLTSQLKWIDNSKICPNKSLTYKQIIYIEKVGKKTISDSMSESWAQMKGWIRKAEAD